MWTSHCLGIWLARCKAPVVGSMFVNWLEDNLVDNRYGLICEALNWSIKASGLDGCWWGYCVVEMWVWENEGSKPLKFRNVDSCIVALVLFFCN